MDLSSAVNEILPYLYTYLTWKGLITHISYLFQLNSKNWFWKWSIDSLIPNLFPSSTWEEYPYVGIMDNGQASNVLGIGRIRQLRNKKG